MADVAFTCPQCGHTYQFAAHLAGKRGRCKTCQAVFRIPELAPTVPTRPAPAPVTTSGERRSFATPSRPAQPAPAGKIVFNCPTCGHGYRLEAKLAGKQGRCTTCRGVFTIPAQSRDSAGTRAPASQRRPAEADRPPRPAATGPGPAPGPARPDRTRYNPPAATGAAGRPPIPPLPEAGDSGWWELDSSESIPAATAPPAAGRSRTATARATAPASAAPAEWTAVEDDDLPVVTATPVRPRWVTAAAIAAGGVVGVIAFALCYSVVFNAMRPTSPPVAEQPNDSPSPSPPPIVADAASPSEKSPPSPRSGGAADRHREAVAALIRAYNAIADGYARIRDPGSIPDGNAPISRAVAQLRSAADRGKGLPPLSPAERQALIRQTSPALLQAVDRVLGELRRLKATPGLRSDFDRLIAAYTRTRQEIEGEADHP